MSWLLVVPIPACLTKENTGSKVLDLPGVEMAVKEE